MQSVIALVFRSNYACWKSLSGEPERYEAEKKDIAIKAIEQLGTRFPGITDQVEAVDVATPLTFERYTENWQGSIMGWLPTATTGMSGKGLDKTLPGLESFYMAGQWVEAMGGLPIHEDLGFVPAGFLEKLWEINPQAVEKHIRGLERHFLEGDDWIWNRQPYFLKDQRPTKPADFPRHGGFYIYQWAFLYTKVNDPQLLEWAQKTTRRRAGWHHSVASMGISMLRANQILGDDKIPGFEKIGRDSYSHKNERIAPHR